MMTSLRMITTRLLTSEDMQTIRYRATYLVIPIMILLYLLWCCSIFAPSKQQTRYINNCYPPDIRNLVNRKVSDFFSGTCLRSKLFIRGMRETGRDGMAPFFLLDFRSVFGETARNCLRFGT